MSKKQVVIIGMDTKQYVGEISDEEFEKLKDLRSVSLNNVFQVMMVDQHVVDPSNQQLAGLSRGYMLLSLGTSKAGLKELNIRPAGWYDLETCGVAENFRSLVDQVERSTKEADQHKPRIVQAGSAALNNLGKIPTLQDMLGKK